MTGYIEESLSLQNKGSDEEDFHISTPNKNNKYDKKRGISKIVNLANLT